MKKPLLVFTAVVCMALLAQPFVSSWLAPAAYWGVVLLAAVLLALAARGAGGRGWSAGGAGSEFLCDSCKFNDARYCSRRERPNATACPDYKRR